jgi:hypothetical protein
MSLKHDSRKRQQRHSSAFSFYVPDTLHETVETFAKSSTIDIQEAYRQLLSNGLLTPKARKYFDLLLTKNSLRRSDLYSEYSKDNSVLRELVDQLRSENVEMKELLLKNGFLKKYSREAPLMKTNTGPATPELRVGIAEFLDRSLKPRKGYAIVELRLPERLHESISTYLNSAALEYNEGIAKLVEFGLGLPQEFASLEEENRRVSEGLSVADRRMGDRKLDAYENFLENKTLALELASLLSENRLLRRRLVDHNLLDERWTGEKDDKAKRTQRFLSKYTFRPRL